MRSVLVLLILAICWPVLSSSAVARGARQADPGSRPLMIINKAHQPVAEVHVSSEADDTWGDDLLSNGPIAPGAKENVQVAASLGCTVDVQIVFPDLRAEERRAVNLCRLHALVFDGSKAEALDDPAVQPNRQVAILNRAARPIAQVFVSSASSDDWGEDRLGDQVIRPSARAEIGYRGGCVDDVRVVFDNKSAEERRGVDLCAIDLLVVEPGWTTREDYGQLDTIVAPPATAQVPVVNKTDGTVTELYLALPDAAAAEAGRDRLGRSVLRPGTRTWVAFDHGDQCRVGVRAVFQAKRPDLRATADLCQSSEITLGP